MIKIEIIYISKNKDIAHSCLILPDQATVSDAIQLSGLLMKYPEIIKYKVGIYAKLVTYNTQLKSGDRVEIYRELIKDPKETRRIRANKKMICKTV